MTKIPAFFSGQGGDYTQIRVLEFKATPSTGFKQQQDVRLINFCHQHSPLHPVTLEAPRSTFPSPIPLFEYCLHPSL